MTTYIVSEGTNDWGWPLPPETRIARLKRYARNVGRRFANLWRTVRRRPRRRYEFEPNKERLWRNIDLFSDVTRYQPDSPSNKGMAEMATLTKDALKDL